MTRLGPVLDVRPLFAAERAAMRDVLTGLEPAEWSRPTVCPGWDVHDVVAHVLDDHVRRLSGTRDGHAGAVFADDETLPAYLARVNEEFVRAMRQASPRVLVDLLAVLGEQLDRVWARTEMEAPAPLDVSWARVGDEPSPAWLDVAREYTELWVHQQQVRDAVGRPGGDGPELMGPVLATFARALPAALRDVERPAGAAITLVVTGPAGGRWSAVRDHGGWCLTDEPGEAAAVVVMDPDTLWRLGSRGIGAAEAGERAAVTGDAELGAAVTGLLAVVA